MNLTIHRVDSIEIVRRVVPFESGPFEAIDLIIETANRKTEFELTLIPHEGHTITIKTKTVAL